MLEKKSFTGGLDLDTEDRFVQQGDYRFALNCRIGSSDKNSLGSIENTKGNTLVNFALPGGTTTCVGAKENKTNNKVYYFLANENGFHSIMEYDSITNIITELVQSSKLNFDQSKPITGIDIVDDDLLYWTTGLGEPGHINIARAKAGEYPATILKQHLEAIAYPPSKPPTVGYSTLTTQKGNNLRGKLFQFRYKYIYFDNRESAWSGISNAPLPEDENQFIEGTVVDVDQNNRIGIIINTGTEFVKKIKVAARIGNLGDFFLINTLDKAKDNIPDKSQHLLYFLNTGLYSSIDISESNKLFDFLPKKAGAQSVIDGNRMTYGDITDGFDNVDNVDIWAIPIYNEPEYASNYVIKLSIQEGNASGFSAIGVSPVQPSAGDVIIVSFKFGSVTKTTTITVAAGDDYIDVINAIVLDINQNAVQVTGGTSAYTAINTSSTTPASFTVNRIQQISAPDFEDIVVSGVEFPNTDIVRSHKRGAIHEFGIVYHDAANRSGTVQTSPVSPSAPSLGSSPFVQWYDDTANKGSVDMNIIIRHTPPSWATHYNIVYSKNTATRSFIQLVASNVTGSNNSNQTISLSAITDYADLNPNSILSYGFVKGDRLRFLKGNLDFILSTANMLDVEIISYDSGTNEIVVPNLGYPSSVLKGGVFEIYNPSKDLDSNLFYEIGETYDIVGGLHRGSTQNQLAGGVVPAVVTLTNHGDVYFKSRLFKKGNSTTTEPIEDFNYSDFYNSAVTNQGKPNIVDELARELRRPTTIVYSDMFTPDTFVNGLGSFLDTNIEEYDQKYGSIQKLYSEDRSLICFQELKVGRIMVNTSILQTLSGDSNVTKSDDILSDMVYYSGEYGIGLHPESFAVYGNRKYFADSKRGAVLRLSADGITPISEASLDNYFLDIFKVAERSTNVVKILGGFDRKFNEYLISVTEFINLSSTEFGFSILVKGGIDINIPTGFTSLVQVGGVVTLDIIQDSEINKGTVINKNINGVITAISGTQITVRPSEVVKDLLELTITAGATLSFNDERKRWSSFYSYTPDCFAENGTDIITFNNGSLYTHNTSSLYNHFYGVQGESQLHVVYNEDPSGVKFFLALEQETNSVWNVASAETQEGQKTNLIATDFEKIENIYWAAFWKDENTTSVTLPLINGDDMRSTSLLVKLENDDARFVKLFSVGVRHKSSELTSR